MLKVYSRIEWVNKKDGQTTPLGATNLNKMDAAINEMDNNIVELDNLKADKETVNTMLADCAKNASESANKALSDANTYTDGSIKETMEWSKTEFAQSRLVGVEEDSSTGKNNISYCIYDADNKRIDALIGVSSSIREAISIFTSEIAKNMQKIDNSASGAGVGVVVDESGATNIEYDYYVADKGSIIHIASASDLLSAFENAMEKTSIALERIDGKIVTYSTMRGATEYMIGAKGLVPTPLAGENKKFLCGDGTWQDVPFAVEPVNNLLATVAGSPLDAVQGKVLDDKIEAVNESVPKRTLLWSSDATTMEDGYVINLSSDDYDELEFFVPSVGFFKTIKGYRVILHQASVSTNGAVSYRRIIEYTSDTQYTSGYGAYAKGTTTYSKGNTYLVPTKIYGIKY